MKRGGRLVATDGMSDQLRELESRALTKRRQRLNAAVPQLPAYFDSVAAKRRDAALKAKIDWSRIDLLGCLPGAIH